MESSLGISNFLEENALTSNAEEAEDIKKRWQEYTEKLYKKNFITQIIMMV